MHLITGQELMKKSSLLSRGRDKRYLPRWEVRNKILYSTESTTNYQSATSKNINCTGACFYCEGNFTPRQNINLILYLSDVIAVEVKGTVLWESYANSRKLIGVRFEDPATHVKEMILKYAFEYKKNKALNQGFKG